jgi:hypothetical protein
MPSLGLKRSRHSTLFVSMPMYALRPMCGGRGPWRVVLSVATPPMHPTVGQAHGRHGLPLLALVCVWRLYCLTIDVDIRRESFL